jgi:hypothetical protein
MTSPTPSRILDIATGYMGAKQLFAATRIGLFRAVADGHTTLPAIAAATGHTVRQVEILAAAMAALGLLTRENGVYGVTEEAAFYLTRSGDLDLSDFLNFLNTVSYRQFLGYDHTVDSDEPGHLDVDPAGFAAFMAGVNQYNGLHAYWLAESFDASAFHHALDFGGFIAGFSVELMKRHPGLTTRYVFPADQVAEIQAEVDAAGMTARARVEAGDTATATPGGDHDLVLLLHVIHRFTPEQNQAIFEHMRASAAPGATLAIFDFFLDGSPQQRRLDALHAAEYYNIDGTVVWSEAAVTNWLAAAGWRFSHFIDVPGSPRLLVATAA